jgi:hypothetical protein
VWQSIKYDVSHSTSIQARSAYCESVFEHRGLSISEDSAADAGHVQQYLCVKGNGKRLLQIVAQEHMPST